MSFPSPVNESKEEALGVPQHSHQVRHEVLGFDVAGVRRWLLQVDKADAFRIIDASSGKRLHGQ
jgi:hypothetical protein